MKLNADIVYAELQARYPVIMMGAKSNELNLSGPELYLDNEVTFSGNRLYLATADHLPVHPRLQKNVVLVVIGDGAKLLHYREQCCLIIIRGKADFFAVNRCLCRLFERFSQWEQQLLEVFLRTADPQEIAACSEPVLGCAVSVLDASFHYLAKPGTWDPESRLETEKMSEYLSNFELRTEKRGAILVRRDGGEYLCVNLFDGGGRYLGCMYLSGGSRPFGEGDSALAEYLGRLLENAFLRNPVLRSDEQTVMKEALANMVNGYPLTANQKWTLNLSREGHHYVCISQHSANPGSRLPRSYLCDAVEREFPNSYAFPVKNTIACFVDVAPMTDAKNDYFTALNRRLTKFLKETSGIAGISNGFTDPYGAKIAYMQAETAIESGRIMSPSSGLFYFRSYALINMVINSTGSLPAEAYFTERLQNLIRHDKTGPISYLDTLRVFLRTSMSYSKTAQELYVHRSTVVDRIGRIEKELDISLKDPDVRLQLEIILKAMEIENMVHEAKK